MIVVARLLFRPEPGRRPEMQQLLRMGGVLLCVLAIFGLGIGLLGWLSLVAVPVAAIVLLMIVDRFRRGEHQALLYTIAAGAHRGVPINESARGFANENGGDTSARALVLAQCVEAGMPLQKAALKARLKSSTATNLAVRLAETLGDMGSVLFRSLEDMGEIDAAIRVLTARLFYMLQVVFVGTVSLTFIMLKIVPVFQKMFAEFGIKLPSMTVRLIDTSYAMVAYGWLWLLPVALVLLIGYIVATLYYVGWLPINFPLVGQFARRYDCALVLRALAVCVGRKMPLPAAIELLGREFPRRSTARRLSRASLDTASGMHWLEALSRRRIVRPAEAAVLAAAERNGNLQWALDEMADSSIRRFTLHMQAWMQFLFPVALLILGGIVGFVVVALFIPLVALIQGLS